MTTKEYLNQAQRLDSRINSKIDQIAVLNELAAKVTSTLSDMKVQTSPRHSKMEDTIIKIMELESEIQEDTEKLIDIKRDVTDSIRKVTDSEQQLILEKRYLCFESWEDISIDLGISIQHTFRLHGEALKKIEKIMKMRVNERE